MPYRILVVDDDPAIRRLLSLLLSDVGHAVNTVADGIEALECLQSAPPDLLLVDLNLPRLGGLDLLRQLPNLSSPPPAIVVSGQLGSRREALGLGAAAFVPKPFEVDSLLSLVGGTLGRSGISPHR